MSHGAVVTRAGIVACPEFNASFVLEQAHSLSVEAAPDVVFGATESVPFTLSVTADNTAFSTSLQSTTDFSAPDDPLWGTCFEMGAVGEDIHVFYDRERTPVRYTRLDDTTLVYSGDQLTTVTRESGDQVQLSYDVDGNLIQVDNDYTGLRKSLSYTSGQLTGVSLAKLT